MTTARWLSLLAAAQWVTACAKPVPAPLAPPFLFGVAESGFQVEMGCPSLPPADCDDRGSDWYTFLAARDTPALDDAKGYLTSSPPSAGPGQWELYDNDFTLAASALGAHAVRIGLEWSRVFPTATDGLDDPTALRAAANQSALDHYHAVLQSLRSHGLTPLVTLNHYTLPSWLHDGVACHQDIVRCERRGWLDHDRAVREAARYAAFCAREFGAEVDDWSTINEPIQVVLPGYLTPGLDRANPPAVSFRFAEAKAVLGALVDAHARMYDAVKQNDTADADNDGTASRVGPVLSISAVSPADPSNAQDQHATDDLFHLYVEVFLDAVIHGDFDADLNRHPTHRDDLKGKADYIGVNYYNRIIVQGLDQPAFPGFSSLTTFNPTTLRPDTDDAEGLHDVLLRVKAYGIPSIVTENGIPDPTDEGIAPAFLQRNIDSMLRAMDEGADVRGYFYWSLLDNFEWNHGMDVRYGLYAVDKNDPLKARIARQAVQTFHDIAKAGTYRLTP